MHENLRRVENIFHSLFIKSQWGDWIFISRCFLCFISPSFDSQHVDFGFWIVVLVLLFAIFTWPARDLDLDHHVDLVSQCVSDWPWTSRGPVGWLQGENRSSEVKIFAEQEKSSGWQHWYSLETLTTSFNVSSEYQNCHPDALYASVFPTLLFFLYYVSHVCVSESGQQWLR